MGVDQLAPADLEALVRRCMALAGEAAARGNAPFGALLATREGRVVGEAANRQVSADDPTAHAEIELLRSASRLGQPPPWRELLVVSNAEPCSMCASALVKADLGALAYGVAHELHMDPDLGVADVFARARRPPTVTAGILAAECGAQIAALRGETSPVD